MAAHVELYTTPTCPFCLRAKQLLRRKGVAYHDINVGFKRDRRAEMQERSGGRSSVPQIFINGQHIGGCDDLFARDDAGELDALLAASPDDTSAEDN